MTQPMRSWQVQTTYDVFQRVHSPHLEVDAGALVFSRFDGLGWIVELAFAPGHWITVHEDESDPTG